MKTLLLLLVFALAVFASADAKFEEGKAIYNKTCISCHGFDGKAETEVQFIVKPRSLQKTILNKEQIYSIVKKGTKHWGSFAAMMPSFESVLDEDELQAIAHYVSKNFNPNAEERVENLYLKSEQFSKEQYPKMRIEGKKIYTTNCVLCHGEEGRGDGKFTKAKQKKVLPYDLSKVILNSKQMFLYTKYGGNFWGSDKNHMQAWSKKYNDYELKSVILYIDETFKGH